MIEIDGAEGEGGGQVLRTALALSLATGQPFRIHNIRAGRSKPGLMRQHVTAIEAACAIGGQTCDGLAVGASSLEFQPGPVRAGEYRFAVGTAGSVGLVLQAILPPLLLADGPSRLVLDGGTHNPHAPPFDFLDRCLFPLLGRMGARVTARLLRHGFYPAGGGRIEVKIVPAPLVPVELSDRGSLLETKACALISALPGEIAAREIASARAVLDWPEDCFTIRPLPEGCGPGNIVLVEARFAHTTEIVSGFGQWGVPAEQVGGKAATRMAGYLASGAFAGPYLADQLLVPMAMAGGGSFTTVKPSSHTRTAIAVIRRFLDREVRLDATAEGCHLVSL